MKRHCLIGGIAEVEVRALLAICAGDFQRPAVVERGDHLRRFKRLHVLLFRPLRVTAGRLRRCVLDRRLHGRDHNGRRYESRCCEWLAAMRGEVRDLPVVACRRAGVFTRFLHTRALPDTGRLHAQRHHHAAHNRDDGESNQYEPVESAASGVLLLQQAFRFVRKIVLAVESHILSRHGSHLAAPA